jgi:hypothetical protein
MNMISAFHGIGAYRGQRNPLALRKMLDNALGGVELCAADRPIGAFGAVFLGHCREVFDQDVWSVVGHDGLRETTGWVNKSLPAPDQTEFESFAQAAQAERENAKSYCEAWLTPCAIRALWIKDWADEKTALAAKIIARHRGIPLIVVSGTTRIWDVLDDQPLPVIPAIYARRANQ